MIHWILVGFLIKKILPISFYWYYEKLPGSMNVLVFWLAISHLVIFAANLVIFIYYRQQFKELSILFQYLYIDGLYYFTYYLIIFLWIHSISPIVIEILSILQIIIFIGIYVSHIQLWESRFSFSLEWTQNLFILLNLTLFNIDWDIVLIIYEICAILLYACSILLFFTSCICLVYYFRSFIR